jgi:hypothetical protein
MNFEPGFFKLSVTYARVPALPKQYRATLKAGDFVVIDELFLRKLPPHAGDELADVIMGRYEKIRYASRFQP